MKIFYTYSPEKDPSSFSDAVSKFSANPNHELVVLCSTDSEAEANDFASSLYESFGSVEIVAKSFASPKKLSEYAYFESRIISSLFVKYPNLGAALFLGRDDIPTTDGWANSIQNLILSSGKPLTGYGKPYRGGVLYPDSLLTNGFFASFTTPKFTHSTTNFRAGMRHEAIHHGVVITDDLIPLSGKPCAISESEESSLVKSREKLQAIKDKVEETKKKAVEIHDQARNGASRREATERAMVQPAPPAGTVTTFGPAFAEDEKISFSGGFNQSGEVAEVKEVVEVVEPPVEEIPDTPPAPIVDKPVVKAVKKQATKKARKTTAKKAAKKSK